MISISQLCQCCSVSQQSSSNYQPELDASLRAVLCGSLLAKTLQNSLQDDEKFIKSDASPVTIADFAVQVVMVEILNFESNKQGIKVIAEEDFESLTHEALNQVVDKLNQHCPLSLLKHKIDDLVSDEIWTPKHILELFTSTRLRNDIELQEYANSIRRGDHWTRTSYFVIDPIDGTKGFLRGEQFAIGLCLVDCYSGEPQVGVIGCPNLPHVLQSKQLCDERNSASEDEEKGQIFFAVKNEGSRCVTIQSLLDDKMEPYIRTLKVKSDPEPLESIACLESYEAKHTDFGLSQQTLLELGINLEHRRVLRLDSMVKYAVIARGDGHVMMRFPKGNYHEKVWDILPGMLVLEEAGGIVTHSDGSKIDGKYRVTLQNTTGIVGTGAGGKKFHDQVVQAIRVASSKLQSKQ